MLNCEVKVIHSPETRNGAIGLAALLGIEPTANGGLASVGVSNKSHP